VTSMSKERVRGALREDVCQRDSQSTWRKGVSGVAMLLAHATAVDPSGRSKT